MYRNGVKISVKNYCKDRKEPTQNQKKILLEEVNGLCPMPGCGKSLVNEVGQKVLEQYEVAHVFPNSHTANEKKILANVEVDGESSETLDNWIALCHDCHKIYDENKTVASYQEMLELKRKLSLELKTKKVLSKERLEEDIDKAIKDLLNIDKAELEKAGSLEYKTLAVKQKVHEDDILCSNIEDQVTKYFNYIKGVFKNLDPSGVHFDLICISVKKVYLQLKSKKVSQATIFERITDWFVSKTHVQRHICEIMTSFFVQNCDVYEISE